MGMDKAGDSIAPERLRKSCFSKHSSSAFFQSAIGTLGYAVLMRLIAYCMLALNTTLGKMQGELIGHVLRSLIITQHLDLPSGLSLCPCLITLECMKRFTLLFKQDYCPETRGKINESHPVTIALWRSSGDWAMEIRYNNGQETGSR
jgi:hypothetical protein